MLLERQISEEKKDGRVTHISWLTCASLTWSLALPNKATFPGPQGLHVGLPLASAMACPHLPRHAFSSTPKKITIIDCASIINLILILFDKCSNFHTNHVKCKTTNASLIKWLRCIIHGKPWSCLVTSDGTMKQEYFTKWKGNLLNS